MKRHIDAKNRGADSAGLSRNGSGWLRLSIGHFGSDQDTAIFAVMTKIEDIEKAVEQLSPDDLAKFREWFEEFDARIFDAKIERDAKAGKLDKLMAEARANHAAGRREEF